MIPNISVVGSCCFRDGPCKDVENNWLIITGEDCRVCFLNTSVDQIKFHSPWVVNSQTKPTQKLADFNNTVTFHSPPCQLPPFEHLNIKFYRESLHLAHNLQRKAIWCLQWCISNNFTVFTIIRFWISVRNIPTCHIRTFFSIFVYKMLIGTAALTYWTVSRLRKCDFHCYDFTLYQRIFSVLWRQQIVCTLVIFQKRTIQHNHSIKRLDTHQKLSEGAEVLASRWPLAWSNNKQLQCLMCFLPSLRHNTLYTCSILLI